MIHSTHNHDTVGNISSLTVTTCQSSQFTMVNLKEIRQMKRQHIDGWGQMKLWRHWEVTYVHKSGMLRMRKVILIRHTTHFLSIFTSLYNNNCPIRQYSRKHKYSDRPWITKGLQNACKKKNTLYREFIKERTKEAENKYKKYKYKLISIIRKSSKEYYHEI